MVYTGQRRYVVQFTLVVCITIDKPFIYYQLFVVPATLFAMNDPSQCISNIFKISIELREAFGPDVTLHPLNVSRLYCKYLADLATKSSAI